MLWLADIAISLSSAIVLLPAKHQHINSSACACRHADINNWLKAPFCYEALSGSCRATQLRQVCERSSIRHEKSEAPDIRFPRVDVLYCAFDISLSSLLVLNVTWHCHWHGHIHHPLTRSHIHSHVQHTTVHFKSRCFVCACVLL